PEPEPVRAVAKRPVPKPPEPAPAPAPVPEPVPAPPPAPAETPAPAPVKPPPQEGVNRLDKLIQEAEVLFEEAKKEKEAAKTLNDFNGAAFKAEAARLKFQALVEV